MLTRNRRVPRARAVMERESRADAGRWPERAGGASRVRARIHLVRPPVRHLERILALALTVLVLWVYAPVRNHEFVNLDDPDYVSANAMVQRGVSWEGLAWAFASFDAANWHPLTWISHMLDVEVLGAKPGGHHLVNVLLHVLNTLLVFSFLRAATGATWRSSMAAALFGVHPLHVESVAWVSERKDVLSALFLLLALRAWVAYARRPGPRWYAAALASVAAGLLAKPMLVTAPLLLLLVDVWPLGRSGGEGGGRWREVGPRLVLEKVPFALLAGASVAVTVVAQATGQRLSAISGIPLGSRLSNAVVSTLAYLGQMLWPGRLASFYPHPYTLGGIPAWQVVAAGALLLGVSAMAVRVRSAHPYLPWGWAWYLVSLLPVIGLVQAGAQARADRYTYLPLLGPFVAMVWTSASLAMRWRAARSWLAAGAALAVLALSVQARRQVGTWRDSRTLHEHAIAVTEGNWKAWSLLAEARLDLGQLSAAAAAAEESIRILPANPFPWNTLGIARGRLGRPADAVLAFREAIHLDRGFEEAWYNLGTAHGVLGQAEEAMVAFREATRLRPDSPEAWFGLGTAESALGNHQEAARCLLVVLRMSPEHAAAWERLAGEQVRLGDRQGALESLGRLRRLDAVAARRVAERLGLAASLP